MAGERRVDRAKWAELVLNLIDQETKGKKEPFARLLGINSRTLSRWLAREVDVSEESVRLVAEKLGLKAMDLLVDVGYYRREEVEGPTTPELAPVEDPAVQLIDDSDITPRMKARLKARLADLRAQRAAQEADEVRWWLDQMKGA